jgi:hypothetical protein
MGSGRCWRRKRGGSYRGRRKSRGASGSWRKKMIDALEKGVFGLVGWADNSGYWAGVSVGLKPVDENKFLCILFILIFMKNFFHKYTPRKLFSHLESSTGCQPSWCPMCIEGRQEWWRPSDPAGVVSLDMVGRQPCHLHWFGWAFHLPLFSLHKSPPPAIFGSGHSRS